MSTSPPPPPSAPTSPDNVQTAYLRTVKKPKIITAKKPRKEDLLNALREASEQGPRSRDTERGAIRMVKKPTMQRFARRSSSTADGPSEMADSVTDNGSDVSTGTACSSHVRPRPVPGPKPKTVKSPVNRQMASKTTSKTYCHQCRNQNLHPKMRCKGFRSGGRACPLAFCRNCIITR